MANTLTQINIHLTFHIKSHGPVIRQSDLPRVHQYIGGIVRSVGSSALAVGGVNDHVHVLLALPKTMSISELVKAVKGRSSVWIKTLGPEYMGFAWQEGYGAFSVSPSLMERTVNYIHSQEERHRVHTFKEEYIMLLNAYGVQYDERYVFDE